MYGSDSDGLQRVAGVLRGAGGRRAAGRSRLLTSGALALAGVLLAGCSSDSGSGEDGGGEGGDKASQRPKSVTPYWVDPQSNAAREAAAYRKDGKAEEAELMRKIADQPVAEWIGADDPQGQTRKVTSAAAKADRDALLVLYNLPHRDCGQYSKGGAPAADAYRAVARRRRQGHRQAGRDGDRGAGRHSPRPDGRLHPGRVPARALRAAQRGRRAS